MRVVTAFDLLIQESLLGVPTDLLQPRYAVDYIHRQTETIGVVVDRQFKWCIDVPFLLIATDMDVVVIRPSVCQPMNELRVAMEVEHHRLIYRKQGIEVAIRESVRMFAVGLQLEQIDHIDEANLQIRKLWPQKRNRSQSLLSRNIAGRGDDHVRFAGFVVAGPIPDPDSLRAVGDGGAHIQILQVFLLVADDHVHIILAAQTVISDGEKAVHIGWQIDASDIGALVDYYIEKSRVLVREAVVVLPPYGRSDQKIERRDGIPPGQVIRDLQPLGVLIKHGIDDMYEGLITGEETVPSGEQISLQHSFQRVLT